MDNRYDKLRNKLRQESELPDSYSWDSMEESILAKVKGEGAVKKLSSLKYLTIALIVVITAVGFYALFVQENIKDLQVITEEINTGVDEYKNELDNKKQKVSSTIPKETRKESNDNNLKLAAISDNRFSDLSKSSTTRSDLNEIRSSIDLKTIKSPAERMSGSVIQVKEKQDVVVQTNNQRINNSARTDSKEKIDLAVTNDQKKEYLEFVEGAKETKSTISDFSKLPVQTVSLLSRNHKEIQIMDDVAFATPIEPVVKISKWSMELGAGMTFLSPQLNGDDFQTSHRSINERGLLAYNTNLSLGYKLSQDWTIQAGISYGKYASELDYYDTRDTMILYTDIPGTTTNALTGEVSTTYSDVLGDAVSYDKVLHKNEFSILSIPVSLSRKFIGSQKLDFSLGLGLQYNYLLDHSGRVLELTESDHTLYKVLDRSNKEYDKSNFGILGTAVMNYHFSPKVYFSAGIHASYGLQDIDRSSALSLRPILMDVRFGLGYRF